MSKSLVTDWLPGSTTSCFVPLWGSPLLHLYLGFYESVYLQHNRCADAQR
jgi:hypothetical protein